MKQEKKGSYGLMVLITGFALFASYFGAGNAMFPPIEGLASGSAWLSSILGLTSSGIFLPILAIIIIGRKGSVTAITGHVHSQCYNVIVGAIMLIVIFSANPRTAALAIETGIQGSFPNVPYIPCVIIYFMIVFLASRTKGKALDNVGKYLTPALVAILLALIVTAFAKPIATPIDTGLEKPFVHAFLTGYNTGDVLGSFLFANVFLATIESKGYKGKERSKVIFYAAIIAFVGLLIVYGGLLYMGACGSAIFPANTGRAELLVGLVKLVGGRFALMGIGLAIILACLTTAITQATAAADFFVDLSKGRWSYHITLAVICILSTIITFIGVDNIVVFSNPIYNTIYPILIAILLLAVFEKYIPNDGAWKGAILLTAVYSEIEAVCLAGAEIGALQSIVDAMPMSKYGFGWFCPCVVGFVAGVFLYRKHTVESNQTVSQSEET